MRIVRWKSDNIWKDRIRTKCIRKKLEATSIVDKMKNNQLRWFGHVLCNQWIHWLEATDYQLVELGLRVDLCEHV